MPRNTIIPYNPKLKQFARDLRNNSTLSEVLLWRQIKGKKLRYEFHRQIPIDEFIVDFYCHELMLVIEVDGSSHNDKYNYDVNRQTKLQDLGVKFIRFSDVDVKKNMNGVLSALKNKVDEIVRTSPRPPSKGESKDGDL
jgi:very-short-patch-repair endonuclease